MSQFLYQNCKFRGIFQPQIYRATIIESFHRILSAVLENESQRALNLSRIGRLQEDCGFLIRPRKIPISNALIDLHKLPAVWMKASSVMSTRLWLRLNRLKNAAISSNLRRLPTYNLRCTHISGRIVSPRNALHPGKTIVHIVQILVRVTEDACV